MIHHSPFKGDGSRPPTIVTRTVTWMGLIMPSAKDANQAQACNIYNFSSQGKLFLAKFFVNSRCLTWQLLLILPSYQMRISLALSCGQDRCDHCFHHDTSLQLVEPFGSLRLQPLIYKARGFQYRHSLMVYVEVGIGFHDATNQNGFDHWLYPFRTTKIIGATGIADVLETSMISSMT